VPDDAAPPGPDAPPPASEPDALATESMTAGGYAYEVVDDGGPTTPWPQSAQSGRGGVPAWTLALAALIPAIIAGAAVWFFFGRDGGSGDDRLHASSSSVLNAFTAGGDGTVTTRYEGELPPDYPDDVPRYDEAAVISSVLQVSGDDAGYIVVEDTTDDRDDVAASLKEQFDTDPWQVDVGQDSRESTLYQFSKIDDADITGIVLLTQSKDGSRTTIITSIQEVSGAADREDTPFTPVASRSTPKGFPEELPVYEGAVVIESAYQKNAQGTSFAISYITLDDADGVLDFYRSGLEDAGLTVEDGDASSSSLEDAQAIRFADEDLMLQGDVTVGTFGEDDSYTRVDVQLGDER
jgi:hypothetical protein